MLRRRDGLWVNAFEEAEGMPCSTEPVDLEGPIWVRLMVRGGGGRVRALSAVLLLVVAWWYSMVLGAWCLVLGKGRIDSTS